MLTRLKITGFKNLVDMDVRFGPFTCIAGGNGVGKSNLFDAIRFLSLLADQPLMAAAGALRNEGGRATEVRSLFTQMNEKETATEMSFLAEMIIPPYGSDEVGQFVKIGTNLVRYSLKLRLLHNRFERQLEIVEEELLAMSRNEVQQTLLFARASEWDSILLPGEPQSSNQQDNFIPEPFIATNKAGKPQIELRVENTDGVYRKVEAAKLTATMLSIANASQNPTAYLTREEMRSWHMLALEPSAMRMPDTYSSPVTIGPDGSHLAATLNHLARTLADAEEAENRVENLSDAELAEIQANLGASFEEQLDLVNAQSEDYDKDQASIAAEMSIDEIPTLPESEQPHFSPTDTNSVAVAALYAHVSNRLAELIGEVREVHVDVNEERQELSLVVTNQQGVNVLPRALSDGTLRFLALAILEEYRHPGLWCIEEPENGIHPGRIPALLDLLQKIAVNVNYPVDGPYFIGAENPLRQVIISTHSPMVVSYVPDDTLLVISTVRQGKGHARWNIAKFRWLKETWRSTIDPEVRSTIAPAELLAYLTPITYLNPIEEDRESNSHKVIDSSDVVRVLKALKAIMEGAE